ncbi:molybdopterin-dependent oxidoreductase [Pelagibius sp. Alg239-R121]|uniref:molybdopterin-containing oxidoreductase family protein n=1 Tax=Pelagibius sp. Alg239-R121 TaxID=2993448 RepID=UPI0024A6A56B|nr:molybdopterin-dependent oxidoreductase [Pelagibius sp. Alg239-R121]
MSSQETVTTKPTICPLDCPDTCSLSVETDGRSVLKVRGSRANPYTAGVICKKVSSYYPDFVHGDRRLTVPLQRSGPRGSGEYSPISWEKALDVIHEKVTSVIETHGAQSVVPFNYAGPHGQIAGGSMDRRFFHKLGASFVDRGPLCGAVRGAAYTSIFGSAPGMPPEQAKHADLIVVVGNNVTVSNLHFARAIKAARRNGAKLIAIDPKRTKIAAQADLFLQIRPGTDVVFFLALAAELERRGGFDQSFIDQWVDGCETYMLEARKISLAAACDLCGLAPSDVESFIELYTSADKVALSVGNGPERGHSGGSSIRAAISLQALTGNFGRLGAGVFAKPGLAFPATPAKLQRPDLAPEGTRTLNIVDIPRHILDDDIDPPIRAVFLYNHNAVCTHPDQNRLRAALSREELFIVGCDVEMNDSMSFADIILPAATHFEFDDIYAAYGQAYLQRAEAVIPPLGEAQPNSEIFRRLAARFGFDDQIFKASDAELMDDAFDPEDPRLNGQRPSELPLDGALAMTSGGEELIMCKTVTPGTLSGRIELFSQDLETRFGYGIPRYEAVPGSYPLVLITPSSSKRTNATFGGHAESQGPERLEIHPVDAAARGIKQGDRVKLLNDLGTVVLIAEISEDVQPGVLYSPKGTWLSTSETGQTVNALISADLKTDIMEGACYNDTYVEAERIGH